MARYVGIIIVVVVIAKTVFLPLRPKSGLKSVLFMYWFCQAKLLKQFPIKDYKSRAIIKIQLKDLLKMSATLLKMSILPVHLKKASEGNSQTSFGEAC